MDRGDSNAAPAGRAPGDGSIDAAIGARIRSLRLHRGLTQKDVARRVGLTFQQVQKYESGANQVGPTKLLQIAEILCVPAGFLLGETQAQSARGLANRASRVHSDEDIVRALEAFQLIRDRKLRKQLSLLLRSIAKSV